MFTVFSLANYVSINYLENFDHAHSWLEATPTLFSQKWERHLATILRKVGSATAWRGEVTLFA
jgi:hypothetical protein